MQPHSQPTPPAPSPPGSASPRSAPPRSVPMIFVVRGRPGQFDRPPLPAGHPLTWGAITAGTLLDHAEYPFPVFLA